MRIMGLESVHTIDFYWKGQRFLPRIDAGGEGTVRRLAENGIKIDTARGRIDFNRMIPLSARSRCNISRSASA